MRAGQVKAPSSHKMDVPVTMFPHQILVRKAWNKGITLAAHLHAFGHMVPGAWPGVWEIHLLACGLPQEPPPRMEDGQEEDFAVLGEFP
jgi:hypothetical protein